MGLLLVNPYVDFILAAALAWLSLKIIQALFGNFTGIAFIGGAIKSAEKATAQAVTNACGHIANGIDKAVGGSIAWVATQVVRVGRALKEPAIAVAQASILIKAAVIAIHGLRSLIHRIEHVGSSAGAGVKTLTKEYHGIERRVKTLEREIGHGIGDDVLPRLKSLDKELDHLKNRVIPGIRAAANDAENEAGIALGKIESIPFPAGVTTWAEAVAVAIPALGLSWLECNSNPFKGNKNGCGLWSQLGKLLGLAAFLTIAFDFRQFVEASDEVAGFIGKSVAAFEGTFPVALPPLPPPE